MDDKNVGNILNAVHMELEKIANDVCDNYCKYPEIYNTKSGDEAYEKMLNEKCESCPLNRLY